MTYTRIEKILICGLLLVFSSCSDYTGFDHPTIKMTIYNATTHTVRISINNSITIEPGSTKNFVLAGDEIPYSFCHDWGDSVRIMYDDSVYIDHIRMSMGGNTVFSPTENNILDNTSWKLISDRTYKYSIDSMNIR